MLRTIVQQPRTFSRFFHAVMARGALWPSALDMLFHAFSKRTRASPRLSRQYRQQASLLWAVAVSALSSPYACGVSVKSWQV